MIKRNYKVKGDDVNDFMVMQNCAFLHYSSKMITLFLSELGISTSYLNSNAIGWLKENDQILNYKKLMFSQEFSVCLQLQSGIKKTCMHLTVEFYNSEMDLAAKVASDLSWIDYKTWSLTSPPNKLLPFLNFERNLRKAV